MLQQCCYCSSWELVLVLDALKPVLHAPVHLLFVHATMHWLVRETCAGDSDGQCSILKSEV